MKQIAEVHNWPHIISKLSCLQLGICTNSQEALITRLNLGVHFCVFSKYLISRLHQGPLGWWCHDKLKHSSVNVMN